MRTKAIPRRAGMEMGMGFQLTQTISPVWPVPQPRKLRYTARRPSESIFRGIVESHYSFLVVTETITTEQWPCVRLQATSGHEEVPCAVHDVSRIR